MKEKLPKPHIHHFEPTFFAQVLSAPPPSAARHPLEDDSGFLGEKVVFDAFLGIPSCPTHPTNMNIEQKDPKKDSKQSCQGPPCCNVFGVAQTVVVEFLRIAHSRDVRVSRANQRTGVSFG